MAYEKLSLNGRVAVVIGGTTGIGRALSIGLAQAGADVVASSRRQQQVDEVAAELEALGRQTLRLTSDVTRRPTLEQLLEQTLAQFNQVDIVVNCAGITKRSPTLDVSEEDWSAIIECNLTGTLRACQVFGRHMIERGYGRIVNIGSLTTSVGFHEVAAYGASKAAVGSLTKTLAVEWGRHGVCVNAIAPGVFRTDLNAALLDGTARGQELKLRTPMGRFGDVNELVGAAIFLASESASFVNGEILAVDGGFLASGVNQ
jgi:NAD(P)-dependent dehydrogenase (short-subunit alcohol dehydrogenase family)